MGLEIKLRIFLKPLQKQTPQQKIGQNGKTGKKKKKCVIIVRLFFIIPQIIIFYNNNSNNIFIVSIEGYER